MDQSSGNNRYCLFRTRSITLHKCKKEIRPTASGVQDLNFKPKPMNMNVEFEKFAKRHPLFHYQLPTGANRFNTDTLTFKHHE